MRLTSLWVAGLCLALGNSTSADDSSAAKTNRLAKESSPYLLLHAHNPVDWYPWSPEAFEKAKAEDKPIFLSIGYSSCYWCHVMERNVFSDADIAEYMNTHFINIKVDREERPDVDDIYMTSLIVYQQLTGSRAGGGWPLSMFLTPEGNPIAGATYLPPEDSPTQGMGYRTIAKRIDEIWKTRRADVLRTGEMIAQQVQKMTRPGVELQAVEITPKLLTTSINQVKELYDPQWGGVDFNQQKPDSPRFPNATRLELALDLCSASDRPELLKIVEHSLQQMAHGGIRDHLAGGFHRYSTDRRWHVPHFEKMLYDQAMLLGVYTRAANLTGKPIYSEVAGEIADFVQRELTTPEGAFCSALDAETNAIEGEYYVWTQKEIASVLGTEDAELFSQVYGLKKPNPFEHGFVLHLPGEITQTNSKTKTVSTDLQDRLSPLRSKLLAVRSERERPLLDDKVLTAWNALMIRALAESGRILDRPRDIAAAQKAANFLLTNLKTADGQLMRTWRAGDAKYSGYLDDYAFMVSALLELHKTTGSAKWLTTATEIARTQNDLFYDKTLQAYYYTAKDHEKLIARTSSVYDSIFPSANSVSVRNLIRLDAIAGTDEFSATAEGVLKRFAPSLNRAPASCCGLARAVNDWLSRDNAEETKQSRMVPDVRQSTYRLTSFAGDESTNTKPATAPPATAKTSATTIQQSSFRPILPATPAASGFDEADKPKPLKVKIYPLYKKLPRKGKCLIAIELQIKRGWHINANPSNPNYLVPTKVELKTKQNVKLTKVKYPKHHELKVAGEAQPYHVYDGKTIVYGLLEIDEKATTKFSELEFHVSFQGCNSNACLNPDKVSMKGKLQIAADGEKLEKANLEKWPKLPAKTKPKQPGETVPATAK